MNPALTLPADQLHVLAAFVVAGAVLAGWGGLFRWLCGQTLRRPEDLFSAIFEGWALLLGALQIWHLAFAVDTSAFIFATAVAAGGWVLAGTALWRRLLRRSVFNLPAILFLMVAAVWLSQHALEGPRHGDAGGYYIPTIRWMREFPIVIGLGNLYAPYAYNQSYFLYAAAAEVGPFAARSYHIVNTALMIALMGRGALALWRVLWPWRRVRAADLYFLLLLPGELALSASIFLTTPSPDVGVFLIGAALFGSVLELVDSGRRAARFHLLAVVLFALAGWTIKLAFAGMAGALLVVVPIGWCWRFRPSFAELKSTTLAGLAIAVFLFVPWLIGNLLMSGCPFFPSATGAIDVPWRVDLDIQKWIQDTMRIGPIHLVWTQPQWLLQRLDGYGWSAPEVLVPLALGGVALVLWPPLALLRFVLRRRRPVASPALGLPWWIIIPPLVSLGFALALTPVPRYAGATMWMVGISFTLLAGGEWLRTTWVGRGATVVAAVAMSVWLATQAPSMWPGMVQFGQSPVIPTDPKVLASGLEVNVPRGVESCFAAPLPCTPKPHPNLKLRRPGDLSSGFEAGS